MVKDEMSLGVQFVRAFRWYVVGVASTLLGLLVLSILGQVSGTVVFYLTEVVAALHRLPRRRLEDEGMAGQGKAERPTHAEPVGPRRNARAQPLP